MVKRELLNFAIDHLTLNIGFKLGTSEESKKILYIVKMFEALESIGLNDTNTNSITDLTWDPFGHEIDVFCERSIHRNVMYAIHFGRYRIMRIEKVPPESTMRENLKNYNYDYRITFYGTLFALSRINQIDHLDFLKPFLADISNHFVQHSISRIDICADIAGTSVLSIKRGITGTKKKMKDFSRIKENPVTKEPETMYYGQGANDWLARFYNKILDIRVKNKESLYPDYLDHEKVTRLEIEAKSAISQKFKITLPKILELGFLLSVYEQVLINKYVKFNIVKFIKSELIKNGLKEIQATRTTLTYDQLTETAMFKRFQNIAKKLTDTYGVTNKRLIESIKTLTEDYPNSK
ncbi:MAG: hypothetical protein OEL89_05050, partial [Candidatus Peregrinibacteria bacterium]|nr:hypothetical protein [Candidatus Peregrinibacteria bacterium]